MPEPPLELPSLLVWSVAEYGPPERVAWLRRLGTIVRDVAATLRRLWQAPADGPFRPLAQMCDEWVAEFEDKVAAGGIPGGADDPLDHGLIRDGLALFRSLPRDASRAAVLPTDLHAENILAAQREPWLVIDPKPYVGDPTYDPLQHMLNHRDRLFADPAGFAGRMAELTDVDGERLHRWLFARCVQESIDQPELARVARLLAR